MGASSLLSLQQDRRLIIALAAVAGSFPLLKYAFCSYRTFVDLGPAGIPTNLGGWLLQALAQPLSRRDTRGPAPYAASDVVDVYGHEGYQTYLASPLPPRRGPRPDVPAYVAPQRQVDQLGGDAILSEQMAFLAALASANPDLFQSKLSQLEGPSHKALWLANRVPVPRVLAATSGEIAHPHGEGSSHMTLSLEDAAAAIDAGWAERHKLSGVFGFLPWTYVMVYAPRNTKELAVWESLVLASARFATAWQSRPVIGL